MKKTYFYLALLSAVIMFNGCSKKSSNNAINYEINGLADVTVSQYTDTSIIVGIAAAYVSGTQEAVTLTVVTDSLPAGVTVTPATLSGTPSFGGAFTFHVDATTHSGTYPILITGTSASSGTKKFHFNLVENANSNCSSTIIGDFIDSTSAITDSTHDSYIYPGEISTTTSSNIVRITTPDGDKYATLNCSNASLTTPADTSSTIASTAGTGTFSHNKVVLHYSTFNIFDPTDVSTITETFTR